MFQAVFLSGVAGTDSWWLINAVAVPPVVMRPHGRGSDDGRGFARSRKTMQSGGENWSYSGNPEQNSYSKSFAAPERLTHLEDVPMRSPGGLQPRHSRDLRIS